MRPYKGSSLVRLHKWVKFELNFVVVDFFGIARIELCDSLKMIIFSSLSWYQSISEKITATTANIYWWHWPKPMCGWFQSIDKKAHRSVGFIWVIIIVYILFLNYYYYYEMHSSFEHLYAPKSEIRFSSNRKNYAIKSSS